MNAKIDAFRIVNYIVINCISTRKELPYMDPILLLHYLYLKQIMELIFIRNYLYLCHY